MRLQSVELFFTRYIPYNASAALQPELISKNLFEKKKQQKQKKKKKWREKATKTKKEKSKFSFKDLSAAYIKSC